ncbi:LPXTG cell wall anchor domain-containing protein [Gemella sp. 20925_1_85]|uniref:LPXTG cell wall anchor domain-containing protein n=1 Tax=Gemella sp. 20925_1_85 TaxID=3003690 RepID=UPI00352ED06C
MKKKLLTSAAIASFLTAAGIVIPQADIFAADTPSTLENTPHPSTVPNEHPSTHPSELEKKEKIVTASNPLALNKVYEGGWGRHNINKKKVDSFAEYVLKDISLDNNKNLNIQTSSDDLSVGSVEYINEANGSKYELNVKKGTVKNSYLADTSKLTGGNYLLNNISLSNSFKNNDFTDENIYTDSKEENGVITGDGPGIDLSRKDLYKYDNKTKIKNLSETKLPELGDKDYLVYSDKTQVGGNDVLKVTVKYKKGLERFADKALLEYYSPNKPGSEAESITGKAMLVYHHKALPGKITLSQIKDGEMIGGSGSFDVDMTLDSEGNDVFYLKNFKNTDPGHYYLRQLHDLDLTKGDLSNFEFDFNPSGKSVYRADKVEEPKAEQPKAEKPKVDEPKIIKPVEPTFPKVELPEKPKTKILEQKVGDRKVSVHFDGTKIPTTNFYAEEVKDKDELAELTKELKAVNPKYKLVNVYDLKLIDSLGNTVDSVGSKRTVTLTNTKGKSVVYYVYRDQNNKLQLEKLPTYDGGNGNIVTFEAEHFSKYALVEEQTDGKQPEGPRAPQPTKLEGDKNTDSNWNPFAQGKKAKEGSTEVKSEGGEVAAKPVSNRKEGKTLPNTGLQTTSYGFLAAIVGLFGAVALRRKNR